MWQLPLKLKLTHAFYFLPLIMVVLPYTLPGTTFISPIVIIEAKIHWSLVWKFHQNIQGTNIIAINSFFTHYFLFFYFNTYHAIGQNPLNTSLIHLHIKPDSLGIRFDTFLTCFEHAWLTFPQVDIQIFEKKSKKLGHMCLDFSQIQTVCTYCHLTIPQKLWQPHNVYRV